MSAWSVPRMWEGQTACILASGSSMSQAVADAVRPTLWRTIAINNTFKRAPWADMLYAADERWWAVHQAEALKFGGLKVSVSVTPFADVLTLKNSGEAGFDPDPANLRTGHNSGYQAVHIAVHAGCKRIILCGFDMHGGHWHKEHEQPLRRNDAGFFIRSIERFGELAIALQQRNVEVLNATPGSALKCFPLIDLKDAIARFVPATATDTVSA